VGRYGQVPAGLHQHSKPVLEAFCQRLVNQVARIKVAAQDGLVAGYRPLDRAAHMQELLASVTEYQQP
jgi:hypothetical protein